jgi:lysozyme family protein
VKQYPDVANATFSPYDAERIYARDYWKYDDITDQRVATKIFDMAVNMGPGQAHKQVQVVLSMALIDGVLGPATVEQINSTDPQKLLDDLCVRSAVFYALLAVVKPVRAAFIPGWVRRAFDQPKI